jgi:hypothetical protein
MDEAAHEKRTKATTFLSVFTSFSSWVGVCRVHVASAVTEVQWSR